MKKEVILITGGTGLMGQQFAKHFTNNDWQVIITSTSKDKAQEFKDSFSKGENIEVFFSDLTKSNAPSLLIEAINSRGIEINHIVNNARSLKGLAMNANGVTERENFLIEYLMHVVVPYEISMNVLRLQIESLKTITNIGSMYGLVAANPNLYSDYLSQSPIQYGTAKAASHHLTKELAVRFAQHNVRVNSIAYGGVEGRVDKNFKDRYAKLVPSGRMLLPEEVVGPLEFLVSDSSSSITGHTIVADGGWTIW
mgnify:CR=1 FL=1